MARNNQRRVGSAQKEQKKAAPKTPTTSVLDFVTPTEFVELPSQGRFYNENHPLHNQETIEIRHMTAKDEDILTSQTLLKKGVAIEKLIQNVIADKTIDSTTLTTGDRNAIIVAARISGYGAEYNTSVVCPACMTKGTYSFDLNNKSVYHGDDHDDLDITETENGTFLTLLPSTNVRAEIRVLTGADESSITEIVQKNKKRSAFESNLTSQIQKFVVSLNEETDPQVINKFVEMMPAYDARHVRKVYRAVTPTVDLSQDFRCSDCGHEQKLEVPFTTDFFWPNR